MAAGRDAPHPARRVKAGAHRETTNLFGGYDQWRWVDAVECVAGWVVSDRVRAKAGLPWPVSGIYVCDKCHAEHIACAGDVTPRCSAERGDGHRCNCAYFVLRAGNSAAS